MRQAITLSVVLVALFAAAGAQARGPVQNPTAIHVTGVCADGTSYDAYTAPGHSVIDSTSTSVQVTEQITLSDPLNEVGGPFSVTANSYRALDAAGRLTTCTGTVAGTTGVTFVARVLKTPRP